MQSNQHLKTKTAHTNGSCGLRMSAEGRESISEGNIRAFQNAAPRKRLPTLSFNEHGTCPIRGCQAFAWQPL